MTQQRLSYLPARCFEGVLPAALATCSRDGMPNATWLSQVFRLDDRHVALSCQFFRKTRDNLTAEPRAQLFLVDPLTLRQWRLDLRFDRRETSGKVFESMAKRLEMIAALTQVDNVFALKSADVFEVMMVSEVEVEHSRDVLAAETPRDPLHALAELSEGIAACRGLEALTTVGLEQLTRHLGLETVSLYLAEESEGTLYTLASRGYPVSGVGARIAYGVGVVGTVAQQRAPVRIADMGRELRYGRVVREQVERASMGVDNEVPLPGLQNVASLLAVPLLLEGELFGVLCTESSRLLAFEERDVLLLSTAGRLLAQAIARTLDREKVALTEVEDEPREPPSSPLGSGPGVLKVRYYEADHSIFLDGEYLIKGLPGRILWLLLSLRQSEGRETFLNRELRLHPLLKLPSYKDNLEARLLMLQRRLQDKASSLRLTRQQRGRLQLHCDQHVELEHTAAYPTAGAASLRRV